MDMFLDSSPKASYIWTWLCSPLILCEAHSWESMRQKPMPPAVMENSIWMPGPESWGQMIHVGPKIRFSEMTDISVLFLFLLARISQSRWKDYHKYTNMNILDKVNVGGQMCFARCILRGPGQGLSPTWRHPSAQSYPWSIWWQC